MKGTLGDLAGTRPGPALVICGGTGVSRDLGNLPPLKFTTVLSANGHAFKLPHPDRRNVDFIVAKDHYHTTTKLRMEPQLRAHGVPIISRQFWADYRMLDWNLQGNSGLTAIAIAAVLGASEIYVVGMDDFTQGSYFHDPDARTIGKGRNQPAQDRKFEQIMRAVSPALVHVVGGPRRGVHVACRGLVDERKPQPLGFFVRAKHEMRLPFEPRARILPGKEFWVSSRELEDLNVKPNVEILDRTV